MEGRRKRKGKWKDFFERLMKEVIEKQEELQKRFLEAIEKREQERVVREEAWRMQEMQRINREREILAQERSMAAAKDARVMAFLQKIAEQQNLGQALDNINIISQQQQQQQQQQPLQPAPQATVAPPPVQQPAAAPPVLPLAPQQQQQQQVMTNMEIVKADNNGENFTATSSSRWPKAEVQALINLRTSLDAKYQESGPKGPLWEEISALMRKIGYNRSAKRCKEKWENINKYFKKVKESNKKRHEDSKTCPYFHQLDALYRERSKRDHPSSGGVKRESMAAALMVRPEQQWPPQQQQQQQQDVTMEDAENDPMERHHHEAEEEEEEEEEKYGDGDEEEEEDEGVGNYEIVASKPASVGASAE